MKPRDPNNFSFFITFEGGEGAGKSTLINRVEAKLMTDGHQVVRTREPGGTKLSGYIREWLLNREMNISIGNKAELLLFLASRAQHLEELIQPALQAGKIVLCDRFNDSTIVYQGVARNLGLDYVQRMCELVCDQTVPNLTFYLDVDPQIGLLRTKSAHKENAKTGEVDRIESEALSFHQLVHQGFITLAKQNPQRIHTIDASQNQDLVFQQVSQILDQLL